GGRRRRARNFPPDPADERAPRGRGRPDPARGRGPRPGTRRRGRSDRRTADPGGGRIVVDSTDLTRLTAADLAAKLTAGEVSSVQATQAHLDRIAAVDSRIHAFLHVNTDEALAAAAEVDSRRTAGEELAP